MTQLKLKLKEVLKQLIMEQQLGLTRLMEL
jgi:hypothetical protein